MTRHGPTYVTRPPQPPGRSAIIPTLSTRVVKVSSRAGSMKSKQHLEQDPAQGADNQAPCLIPQSPGPPCGHLRAELAIAELIRKAP